MLTTRCTLAGALGTLAVTNVVNHTAPPRAAFVVAPVSSAVLVWLAGAAGLSGSDLGLVVRDSRGARHGAAAAGLVAAAYAVALAVPRTRRAFLDTRYDLGAGQALLRSLMVVPLGTVVPEELAFRGVLWALLRRDHGAARATAVSSTVFGLWHVLPALWQGHHNETVGHRGAEDRRRMTITVASVVCFTGVAGVVFCELRRRSDSLLAPIALHWATNGLGVLGSTVAWRLIRSG